MINKEKMKKYIRTNNQIIETTKLKELTSEKYVNDCIQSGFKTSDNLVDLCDEFVMINNSCFLKPQIIDFTQLDMYKGETIYGAIWTEKGLTYIAKLNEKGELELL